MSTIYWIEMLDGICCLFLVFTVILIVLGLCYIDSKDGLNKPKRGILLIILGVLFFIVFILTPKTEQAYRIWGIGGTIEYLKNDKDAKQLPDKTLKILNKWADSYLEEDSTNINK